MNGLYMPYMRPHIEAVLISAGRLVLVIGYIMRRTIDSHQQIYVFESITRSGGNKRVGVSIVYLTHEQLHKSTDCSLLNGLIRITSVSENPCTAQAPLVVE